MKHCIESNRRWWIFIRKKNPIFDFFHLVRVSVFLTHLRAHKTGRKQARKKSRSDQNAFLFILSIYAAKREENWSWRQKNTSSTIKRRTVKHFYFFLCFAFACACCVKRAITRRKKEKNEKYLVKKNVEAGRERRLYGNCVTFYGMDALDTN